MSRPGHNGSTPEYNGVVVRYKDEVRYDQGGKAFHNSKAYYLVVCISSG
jgi:hypothetical protein